VQVKAYWTLPEALAWIMFRTPEAPEAIKGDDAAGIMRLHLDGAGHAVSLDEAQALLLDRLQRGLIDATGCINGAPRNVVHPAFRWNDLAFYFDPDRPSRAGPRAGGPPAPEIAALQFSSVQLCTRWPAIEPDDGEWTSNETLPLYVIVALSLHQPVPPHAIVLTGDAKRLHGHLKTAIEAKKLKASDERPSVSTRVHLRDLKDYVAKGRAPTAVAAFCERWAARSSPPAKTAEPTAASGPKRKRASNAAKDVALRAKITAVLRNARQRFGGRRPSVEVMATRLVEDNLAEGYDAETVGQILDGRYPAQVRRGIPGL
jgi:hypothetical protein